MTQDEALDILKTGASVFLTGEPGSGKTHTINQYVSWLRRHGIEPSITASTGIAATHIGGYTLHSWSGIGVKRDLSTYDLDAIASNKRVYGRVRDASVLIIDEVSMLSDKTLAMVDAVCREIKRDRRPFGGLQVVLVGDFFQLPPVATREDAREEQVALLADARPRFAFASAAWRELNPLPCYLNEQHRQEDALFLDFLSAVRRGAIEEAHYELLRARYAREAKAGMTQLYSHNADVDALNSAELAKLPSTEELFEMTGRGSENLIEHLKRGCLSPERLALKIGARVMFTKNDVITRRYVNGTLGEITGFADDSGYPLVRSSAGRTLLAQPVEWSLQDGGRILAQITQVPLRLAWAMTVHKSQGMSLDAAHMDLSQTFEYGQGYVALSRVRTLKGLSLAGLNDRVLQVHPDILKKDTAFRGASDATREAFSKMSAAELAAMHTRFIRACGGRASADAPTPGAPKATAPVDTTSRLFALRTTYPNAYRTWSKEADSELSKRYAAGEKPTALAKALGRQQGSIRARLLKLGLTEE